MTIDYFWKDSEGKVRVRGDLAFIRLYPILPKDIPLNQVSQAIFNLVVSQAMEVYGKRPSSGSLNNCKGRWNELSLLYSAHTSIMKETDNLYLVKMGSESSIKFWEVYTPESRASFERFLNEAKQHQLFIRCSTPDFVLVKRQVLNNFIPNENSDSFFEEIKNLYRKIRNKCNPSDVISFISIKTSNRPDRRYQILYEANITKYASQYIHDASDPLRFDAIGESTQSDAEVFNAPFLPNLRVIDMNNIEREISQLEYPVIDSDTKITTLQDLDNYWKQFT